MDLRKQAFSGVRWTTLSSLGAVTLQLAQIVILARLLKPEDFGLFAIVIAITAILQIFSDVGVSNAIIHFRDIDQVKLSSLYWLNVAAAVVIAILIVFFSPWVASFFETPELQPILMLTVLAMVINASAQQIRVVAQKKLRFAALAKVELTATLVGFTAAVSVALLGGGIYALVAGYLTAAATGTVLVWIYLAEGWRPKLLFRLNDIRLFLKFGFYMMGDNLANTFNSQVDLFIGGRLLGTYAIGLYSVPKNLSLRIAQVINPIVTRVGLPVMAKVQGEPERLKKIYLQSLRMTASVNFPIFVALGLLAPEVVQILLGDQWLSAAPLLRIFAVWGLFRSIGNPVGSLLLALGRADLSFKWNLSLLFIIPPTIWAGSQFGIQGMVLALTGLAVIGYVPNWYFLVRPLCHAQLAEYTVQIAIPLVISLVAGLLSYFAISLFTSVTVRLTIGSAVGGLSYLLLSFYFNKAWYLAMVELLKPDSKTIPQ